METLMVVLLSMLCVIMIALVVLVVMMNQRLRMMSQTARPMQPEPQQTMLFEEHHGVPHETIFPELEFTDKDGQAVSLVQPDKQGVLAIFTSAGCSTCKMLYKPLMHFLSVNPQLGAVLLLNGSPQELNSIAKEYEITIPIVMVSSDDMARMQTRYTPFVYYLTPDGRVISKSVINYEDQLAYLITKKIDSAA
ncbi:TlpA family protein disulfide reductase [Paenibacillus xylaniclasticus]|uniref:TlpA family protein disulfide reductase n=1 Tax=Paenibacillus xylaniclasticus TaxID=588083 RepID=UPI000FD79163|nr:MULTISPECIES: hypothetical protein [Paenibacillus]GFN33319.1 hypothetical protein PCURB6_35790 [Paenibacillus curdlanolyticus]